MANPQEQAALQAKGQALGRDIMAAMAKWQNNSPRTQQSTMRVLGPSELGTCREYIRASIAGEPKAESTKLKWAAFVGTALGDMMERALFETMEGVVTQERVTCTLPGGMRVSGSTDARLNRKMLIDFKSKDGLTDVMGDGPQLKECIQISTYLVGALQADRVDEDATAHLVYIDRSGKTPTAWVYSIDMDDARMYLGIAEERIADVTNALAAGITAPSYLRDQPESWCYHVQCPFYQACWGDEAYNPTAEITHPELIAAIEKYDRGRDLAKQAKELQTAAKTTLNPGGDEFDEDHPPVSGVTDKYRIKWQTRFAKFGDSYWQIDVRKL